jgi:hypothetical protein
MQGSTEPEVISPSLYVIRNPEKIGTTWVINYETNFFTQNMKVPLKCYIVDTNAVVTVPAGTFEKCLRVYCVGSAKKNLGQSYGIAEVGIESHDWFAPAVGSIKSIANERSNNLMMGAGGTLSIQLENLKK